MSILEDYWSGVLRRVQAEVDTFNRLIEHQGEKGRENELSLARVLEQLIPARYGVGSGLLIDSEGNSSKQMDIVVFEQADQPSLMAQTNQVLFPIESVRLCIEVKTTADKGEIEDAVEKRNSILSLKPQDRRYPSFAFVGYSPASRASTLAGHFLTPTDSNRICIACVLQAGLFACSPKLSPKCSDGSGKYIIGVAALQKSDCSNSKIAGEYEELDPTEDGAYVLRGDHRYPVVETPRGYVIGEPSRALLLFCEAILNALSETGTSIMSHYITRAGRRLITLN